MSPAEVCGYPFRRDAVTGRLVRCGRKAGHRGKVTNCRKVEPTPAVTVRADLPDCAVCGGTGKNIAGLPGCQRLFMPSWAQPPADVVALQDVMAPGVERFLVRGRSGWVWSEQSTPEPDTDGVPWDWAAGGARGPLLEVLTPAEDDEPAGGVIVHQGVVVPFGAGRAQLAAALGHLLDDGGDAR